MSLEMKRSIGMKMLIRIVTIVIFIATVVLFVAFLSGFIPNDISPTKLLEGVIVFGVGLVWIGIDWIINHEKEN